MGIMNLAEIMDRSIDKLKKHIKTIALFSLVYGFISIVLVFAFVLIGTIFYLVSARTASEYSVPWLGLFLIAVLSITISQSYNVGLIRISSQDILDEKISFEDAIKLAFKSIPRVFGIAAVTIVAFLPVVGIFAAIVHFMYGGFNNITFLLEYDSASIVVGVIIVIAALFVYYLFSTILSFSIYGVAIEGKGVFASIMHSYQLIKNNYWKVFGSLLLFSLTVYAFRSTIESFFLMVINLLYLILKLLSVKPNYLVFTYMLTSVGRWPLSILSWLVITPIGTIMTSFLYFNQRFKKEGYDLTLRLREIEKRERNKVSEAFKYNNSNPTGI